MFEDAYEHQVETDIVQLKSIGELKHNYEQMTQQIMHQRNVEFAKIEQQISETLQSDQVYESEESTRKQLL